VNAASAALSAVGRASAGPSGSAAGLRRTTMGTVCTDPGRFGNDPGGNVWARFVRDVIVKA
jgi:hypothetical protein